MPQRSRLHRAPEQSSAEVAAAEGSGAQRSPVTIGGGGGLAIAANGPVTEKETATIRTGKLGTADVDPGVNTVWEVR